MKVLFLSPHYDDVVLSSSFTLLRHLKKGDEVKVVTIFGGADNWQLSNFGYYLHYRWGLPYSSREAIEFRKAEDVVALHSLGVAFDDIIHLDFSDSLYRMNEIDNNQVAGSIDFEWADKVYAPWGIRHLDHVLLAEIIWWSNVTYYIDFPYFYREKNFLGKKIVPSVREFFKKYHAVKCYKSQCKDLFDNSHLKLLLSLFHFERMAKEA